MLSDEPSDTKTPLKKVKPVERALWPAKGFVILKQILGKYGGPIPISESRWWLGVREREFPEPIKVGGRTVWCVSDIDALIARLEQQNMK